MSLSVLKTPIDAFLNYIQTLNLGQIKSESKATNLCFGNICFYNLIVKNCIADFSTEILILKIL